MTTIKVPFPKLEGLEIKNATVDIENGVSVVEYGAKEPKFKKGDIVANRHFILPFMGRYENDAILFNCYYDINNRIARVKDEIGVGCGYINGYRLATPAEQQLLFDALAKEGKKWNPETLQIEDIQKDILVPESIGIYRFIPESIPEDHNYGDNLCIAFNNRQQSLFYWNGQYAVDNLITVFAIYKDAEKVQCKLTPCKREDLKAGDTAYQTDIKNPKFDALMNYCKILDNGKYAYSSDPNITVSQVDYDYWYKVEPINCK